MLSTMLRVATSYQQDQVHSNGATAIEPDNLTVQHQLKASEHEHVHFHACPESFSWCCDAQVFVYMMPFTFGRS
jgi:hypothetical protein